MNVNMINNSRLGAVMAARSKLKRKPSTTERNGSSRQQKKIKVIDILPTSPAVVNKNIRFAIPQLPKQSVVKRKPTRPSIGGKNIIAFKKQIEHQSSEDEEGECSSSVDSSDNES